MSSPSTASSVSLCNITQTIDVAQFSIFRPRVKTELPSLTVSRQRPFSQNPDEMYAEILNNTRDQGDNINAMSYIKDVRFISREVDWED